MGRPDAAPQGYFGLDTIASRMGVSRGTILAWHRRHRFPLYIRHVGPRRVWYTHEGLIGSWETARCLEEHERRYGASPLVPVPAVAPEGPAPSAADELPAPPSGIARATGDATGEVLDALRALSAHVSRIAATCAGAPRDP